MNKEQRDAERVRFEAWAIKPGTGDIEYADPVTDAEWKAWQARALLSDAAPQEPLTDDECAVIYKRANGEDVGKAQPLTTARIFRAMRAMLEWRPNP